MCNIYCISNCRDILFHHYKLLVQNRYKFHQNISVHQIQYFKYINLYSGNYLSTYKRLYYDKIEPYLPKTWKVINYLLNPTPVAFVLM